MDTQFKVMHRGTYSVYSPDPQSFEGKLVKAYHGLQESFFGMAYDVGRKKTLKRDKSNETLVELLCAFENRFKRYQEDHAILLSTEVADYAGFLKLILERDADLVYFETDLFGSLGIKRDRSGLSEPEKKEIAFQAAAQVLWYIEKSKIPTIHAMKEALFGKKYRFCELLEVEENSSYPNARTVSNWIGKIFPVPDEVRKGRYSLLRVNRDSFTNLILIPRIFSKCGTTVNFLKLRFVLICITLFLRSLGYVEEKITESELIRLYVRAIPSQLTFCWKAWIREAFVKNSSIFTP